MATVYLSLGSNVGDRAKHLRWALRRLAVLPRTRLLKVSRFYQTRPEGVERQRNYLNAAASIRTALSPVGLLVHLKALEAQAGRRPARRWSPRPLDIDILFYENRIFKTRWLVLPHPLALKRAFVLAPLAEIAPKFRPPNARKRTIREILHRLKRPIETVKILS